MKLIIEIPDEQVCRDIVNGDLEPQTETDKVIADALYRGKPYEARPQGEWGKWIIAEIQCPNCFEYFDTDCYSKEKLKKCPNCGADMRKGGTT